MGGGGEAMGAPTLPRAPFAHPQRAAGAASSPRSAARCRYGQRCSARWGRRPTAAVGPGGGGHAISSSAHSGAHSAARPCKERSAHAAPRRLLGVPRRCCWEHPLPRGRAPRGHRCTHLAAPSPPLTPHTARCPRAELGVAQPSPPCCPAVPLCSQAAPADGSGGADVWHCIARSARTAERTHVRRERFNAEPSALPARPRRKHRVPPRCCREEQ